MVIDETNQGKSMFCEIAIDSWNQIPRLLSAMKKDDPFWIFRGQGDTNWPLSTRFERDARNYGLDQYWYTNRERFMIEQFKRGAHRYIQNLPDFDSPVEWLAYMQHYGGSTRLLDFTYSIYVAAFFAMDGSTVDSAIWAIGANHLRRAFSTREEGDDESEDFDRRITRYLEMANSFIEGKRSNKDLVLMISPPTDHERLWVQQGLFLFPCNFEGTFEKNLCAHFGWDFNSLGRENAKTITIDDLEQNYGFGTGKSRVFVLKITIPRSLHTEALYSLYDMNITPASLLPGLDGFTRSVNIRLRIKYPD